MLLTVMVEPPTDCSTIELPFEKSAVAPDATTYSWETIDPVTSSFAVALVVIGTTAPASLLHVGSSSVAGGTTVARFQSATGTCTVTPNTGMSCASDERLKQNFETVSGEYALDKILNLQAYNYEMKSDPGKRQTGYIAQEVREIAPELVRQDEGTGLLEVFYSGFIPWITESIKSLHAKIMGHERDIASVKADNAVLKSDNAVLKNENENLKQRLNEQQRRLDDQQKELEAIKRKLGL